MDEVSCEDALSQYQDGPSLEMETPFAEVKLYQTDGTYIVQYRVQGNDWQAAPLPDHFAQMIPVYMGMLQQGE